MNWEFIMSKKTEISFNLVDQPWIPVRDLQGNLIEVSLEDALLNAGKYHGIEDSSPLVVISLYRFLLAVLHRALNGPSDISVAAEWYKNGLPNNMIKSYLKKWYDRFDLFHEEYPFYQTTAAIDENFFSEWQRLSSEEGNYNTSFLYNYSKRDSYALFSKATTPSHIARLLLEHSSFALDGLIKRYAFRQGNTPLIDYAIMLIKGKDLFQDLIFNLVPYPNYHTDEAAWERAPYSKKYLDKKTAPSRKAKGVVDLYTWLSRSYYIKADGCGLIYQIYYASGVDFNEGNYDVIDPMLRYCVDKKKGIKVLRLKPGKSFWRDFNSIYNSSTSNSRSPIVSHHARTLIKKVKSNDVFHIRIYGLLKSKSGQKIDNQFCEEYLLPSVYRDDDELYSFFLELIEGSLTSQEKLNMAVWNLSINLLKMDGKASEKDVLKIRKTLPHEEAYWSHMGEAFHHLLSMLNVDYIEKQVVSFWKTEQIKALQKAWRTVEITVGSDGRALRALSKSTYIITQRINELKGVKVKEEIV